MSADRTTAPAEQAIFGRGPRRTLAIGALLLAAGLAMVGTGPSDVGTGVTLVALVVVIFGVHSFGRLGPDEPEVTTAGSTRPKRRRKRRARPEPPAAGAAT
jgi:hypothetical protein